MGMQESYRIYTEISKKNDIQSVTKRYPANHPGSVQMERDRNHRRTYDAGPHPPAGERTAKIQYLSNHGISQGKECDDDLRAARELKHKYGNRNFWATGYYVSTAGINTATVQKYIREQEKQDQIEDSLSRKEYQDPFTGSK